MLAAALSQSFSLQSSQRGGNWLSAASACLLRRCLISHVPSSLIRKNDTAWALSMLLADLARTLMSGAENRSLPSLFLAGTSCIVTLPVSPVETTSTASSSGVSGAGLFELVYVSGPDTIEVPRATRRVRRSKIADISGYVNNSCNPLWDGGMVSPLLRHVSGDALGERGNRV